jgi:bacteriocin-like protein
MSNVPSAFQKLSHEQLSNVTGGIKCSAYPLGGGGGDADFRKIEATTIAPRPGRRG